jgi:hypothetical protein
MLVSLASSALARARDGDPQVRTAASRPTSSCADRTLTVPALASLVRGSSLPIQHPERDRSLSKYDITLCYLAYYVFPPVCHRSPIAVRNFPCSDKMSQRQKRPPCLACPSPTVAPLQPLDSSPREVTLMGNRSNHNWPLFVKTGLDGAAGPLGPLGRAWAWGLCPDWTCISK